MIIYMQGRIYEFFKGGGGRGSGQEFFEGVQAVAYRGGGRGPWPPGASLGGGAGPACRGEF